MFRRTEERAEIRRLFERGTSIQMLAPRRVGKTWLLHRIREDLVKDGWTTIFSDVEGMRTEEEFLRDLCSKIADANSMSAKVFGQLSQRLKQLVSGDWDGNPIKAIGKIDPRSFCEALVAALNSQSSKTAILVDEIALFVMTRLTQDEKSTLDFLYHVRKLRQNYPAVVWLFTGSIGLDTIARRAGLQGAFIDMAVFPLEPFSTQAARAYVEDLSQRREIRRPFALDDATFEHLANQLGWLSPFYLRHIADHVCPTGPQNVAGLPLALPADVDRAFGEILKPAYRPYFAAWEEHIKKNFIPAEQKLIRIILTACSSTPAGVTTSTVMTAASKQRPSLKMRALSDLLTALASDGYLDEVNLKWRFRSGLLRRYWERYQAE